MIIVGCVVLYNPDISVVISNIKTYYNKLNELYIYDNSDHVNNNQGYLFKEFDRLKYFGFNINNGIAHALNFLSKIAIYNEYKWILTMDQDSSFSSEHDFGCYLNFVEENDVFDLFCPKYPGEGNKSNHFFSSGSIYKLYCWDLVGGYNNDLFIDEVDGDFTYRLKKNNFRLKKVNQTILIHKLGDPCSRRFFSKVIYSDNHSPIRKYYIARNRIYLMKTRKDMRFSYLKDSLKKFILFLLVEDNKINKTKMICKGIYHGLIGKMGKYCE